MTRSEFLDNITEWYELKDFCNDFDCDVCEDIYDDDDYDDCVEEDIRDAIADYGWRDIRDFLGNLPSGYDYYRRNSTLDYDGLGDDDFEDYKEDVLEWGDDYGVWEDEEEEEYARMMTSLALRKKSLTRKKVLRRKTSLLETSLVCAV